VTPKRKQEKGEGRKLVFENKEILPSPFSCNLFRQECSVTVKDVELIEPHSVARRDYAGYGN
jgi:hypothetical protein